MRRPRSRRLAFLAAGAALAVSATACGAPSDSSPSTAQSANTADRHGSGQTRSVTVDPTTPSSSTTTSTTTSTTSTTSTTTTTVPEVVERSGADVGPSGEVGVPLAIRIPSIGVDDPVVPTGVHDDGTVAVPPDANIAGWFDRGPRPGERGPAVIMGHVDSARTGPGVFYNLRNIEVGDVATVDTETGSHDFVVERVEQHPKVDFPTEDVYGPVPSPALRLVTCGGSFNRSVRSYYDNIIVYLVPVHS